MSVRLTRERSGVRASLLPVRGYSSVGRAIRSQRIGQGFESPYLHDEKFYISPDSVLMYADGRPLLFGSGFYVKWSPPSSIPLMQVKTPQQSPNGHVSLSAWLAARGNKNKKALKKSGLIFKLEMGLEPTTYALRMRRSTD